MDMHPGDMTFCVQTIRRLAMRSRATRAQVGCVIWHMPSRRIVSLGYNGTPAGADNLMEVNNKTLDSVIHAEMNALSKMSWWERWLLLQDCALFVTHTPCVNCTDAILRTRIPVVYYLDNYGNSAYTLQRFREHKRKIMRLLER
jgi:dCMP deaminase